MLFNCKLSGTGFVASKFLLESLNLPEIAESIKGIVIAETRNDVSNSLVPLKYFNKAGTRADNAPDKQAVKSAIKTRIFNGIKSQDKIIAEAKPEK